MPCRPSQVLLPFRSRCEMPLRTKWCLGSGELEKRVTESLCVEVVILAGPSASLAEGSQAMAPTQACAIDAADKATTRKKRLSEHGRFLSSEQAPEPHPKERCRIAMWVTAFLVLRNPLIRRPCCRPPSVLSPTNSRLELRRRVPKLEVSSRSLTKS